MIKKRGRPPHGAKKRTHYVKVYLNDEEFKLYQSAVSRLKEHSPALPVQDLFRKILFNIDDLSLIEFVNLPLDHECKVMLRNEALFKGI